MSKSAKSKNAGETVRPVREKNYKLWIMTYHGNSLKPIRDEFIRRVTDGLRRNIFVIDMDNDLKALQEKKNGSFISKKLKKNSKTIEIKKTVDILTNVLNSINKCRQEYDFITETIEQERKFDILEYWKKDLPIANVIAEEPSHKSLKKGGQSTVPDKSGKGGGEKTAKGAGEKTAKAAGGKTAKGDGSKTGKMTAKQISVEQIPTIPECPKLFPKMHNTVGNAKPLSKRKYIEDWPENSKIFIIIMINDQENAKKLYTDLLSRSEPVQAIIHFLPQECAYDILLPQKNAKEFLLDTWEEIQKTIYLLRQISLLKPVGMFQQQLPVISICLAEKLTHQIFDELSWYLYDLEILHQHYVNYYFNAFHLTNVAMHANVNVAELREFAESLSIQGHFLQSPMPAMKSDIATIAAYMESLLSTVEKPTNTLTELDMLLLSAPMHRSISGAHQVRLVQLLQIFKDAFRSITRIKRFNRLILEENNRLLHRLISYTDITYFRHIYHCCLEYNIMRDYVINSSFLECIHINNPLEVELEPFYLPPYCNYFPTRDGITQRLAKLTKKYHEYEVDIMSPGMKLYRFKRRYNEIIEDQKMVVIPSRLCFRDFTLFQMEEFVENLITPEMRDAMIEAQLSAMDPDYQMKRTEASYNIDNNTFVRPNSLKARKLATQQQADHISNKSSQSRLISSSHHKIKKSASAAAAGRYDGANYVGLPPDHPLLKGYNLEDIRQEVTVKTSSYYFEEGRLRLYEDRVCFTDLNKSMNLKLKQCQIYFNGVRNNLEKISHTICVRSKNDIGCRLLNNHQDAPKVVLNYPNGLVIHNNEINCEQTWLPQETFKEERRRIMTPDGSVIVFFKAEDVIRIMRFNGEVYELFQYETFGDEEEEAEGENDEICFVVSPVQTYREASSQRSVKAKELKDIKGQKEIKLETKNTETNKDKDKTKKEKDKLNSAQLPKQSSELEENTSSVDPKDSISYLKEVIENELKFLAAIKETYCLTYVNVKITTSVGRVMILKHTGQIVEKRPISMVEWHDYFANESYAMRGDCVKLIWNKDEFKCYHADETLIRTTAADVVFSDAEVFEEVDTAISQSSSHIISSNEMSDLPTVIIDDIYEALRREMLLPKNAKKTREQVFEEISIRKERLVKQMNLLTELKSLQGEHAATNEDYTQYLEKIVEEEEPLDKDIEYVVFKVHSFSAHQEHYATVHFQLISSVVKTDSIEMEIIAADEIRVMVVPESIFEKERVKEKIHDDSIVHIDETEESKTLKDVTSLMSKLEERAQIFATDEFLEQEPPKKVVIRIHFGDDVFIKLTEKVFKLEANMQRNDEEFGTVPDVLDLQFNFDDDKFVEVYKNFAQCIADFKNYNKPKCKEKIFLEVEGSRTCTLQGFDFINKIPSTTGYSYAVSNTVTVLEPVCTMSDELIMEMVSKSSDMLKFPRFRKHSSRKSLADTFPRVATCRVYIKIPKHLRHTDEIEKFVEPLDKTSFKRMRRQMKENIIFHIKPQIRMQMQRLTSRNSWKRRQLFHKCRLLLEMQRKGLYHAMLKHKTFPNYQNFRDHFDYHVRHIDFFEFMIEKCSEEALKKKKDKELLAEERGIKPKMWSHNA